MKRYGSTATLTFCFLALTLALFVHADWATAEPSEEQVAAIKANCRSDFLSKCRGVPRGGAEAMQCLKDNAASVSPGCQQALKPLMAATPSPAPAVAKPESAPAPAPQPTPETTAKTAPAAPESKPDAAAATSPSTSASEPAPSSPPKAAAKPPAKETAPSSVVKTPAEVKVKEPAAVEPPSAAAKPPAAAPAAPETETAIIGFIPPRKKLMILRNCRKDLDTYCPGVEYGEGRQLSCLVSHKAQLTPDCQGALAKLTR